MAYTVYPNAIDSSDQLPISTDDVTPVKAEVVNRQRDAILAVESELGIQPSGTYTTVRARLDALDALIATIGGGLGALSQVLDEGTVIRTSVTSINFIGPNVTASSASVSGRVDVTISDLGAETLAQTLALGNTTGGNDIILSSGDSITSATGTINLNDDVNIIGKLTVSGLIDPTGLILDEQASRPGSVVAGKGTVWIRNDTPNILIFTDDSGVDHSIAGNETLAQTLVLGNTTGGTDIRITSGDSILGVDGSGAGTGAAVTVAGGIGGTTGIGGAVSLTGGAGGSSSGDGGATTVAGGASTSGTGGALTLKSGTGTTAHGNFTIARGSVTIVDATSTNFQIGANDATYSDVLLLTAASSTNFNIGGSNRFLISTGVIRPFLSNMSWSNTISNPSIGQQDDTGTSSTGDTFTFQAQNATGTTSIGGALILASGTGTTNAGDISLRIGSTTVATWAGASPNVASTGIIRAPNNTTIVAARNAANSADLSVISTDSGDITTLGNTSGNTNIEASSTVGLRTAGTGRLTATSTAITIVPVDFRWGASTAAPRISQIDDTASSSTGEILTVQAQNATGVTSTGGALVLTSGTGTSNAGDITLEIGGTVVATWAGSSPNVASTGILRTPNNTAILAARNAANSADLTLITTTSGDVSVFGNSSTQTRFTGSLIQIDSIELSFRNTVANPTIKQSDDSTGSITGDTLTLQAQNATGATSTGGQLTLTSGTGTTTPGAVAIQRGGTTLVDMSGTDITFGANSTTLSSSTTLASGVNAIITVGGGTKVSISTSVINLFNSIVRWSQSTTNPTLTQVDRSSGSLTGETLTIQAQNNTQASSTGGDVVLLPGTGTSANGIIQLDGYVTALEHVIGGVADPVNLSDAVNLRSLHSSAGNEIDFRISGVFSGASVPSFFDPPYPIRTSRTIVSVTLIRRTAGSSGTTRVDILKNGVSIFASDGAKPQVSFSDGDNAQNTVTVFTDTTLTAGDYLDAELETVESGAAEGLTILVRAE